MISLKKGETEKGAWESARGTVSDAYCAAQALLALGKDKLFQNAFPLQKGFFPNPSLCHKTHGLGSWLAMESWLRMAMAAGSLCPLIKRLSGGPG